MDPLGISVVPRVPKDHCLIKVSRKTVSHYNVIHYKTFYCMGIFKSKYLI